MSNDALLQSLKGFGNIYNYSSDDFYHALSLSLSRDLMEKSEQMFQLHVCVRYAAAGPRAAET